jgi:hypothetical protein
MTFLNERDLSGRAIVVTTLDGINSMDDPRTPLGVAMNKLVQHVYVQAQSSGRGIITGCHPPSIPASR